MPSTISAGTTAGTAIAIAGDTTGNLAFQTNGTTTAVTIDTSQNVGIGTTNPGVKLHVNGSGSIIRVATDTSTSGTVDLYATSTSAIINANTYATAVPLVFQVASTERMRIDSSGNVLVQAPAPQFTQTLTPSFVCPSVQRNYTVRANQNGGSWVNFWLIDTTRASFTAHIDVNGTENGSFNVYHARWTLAYGASGGTTIAGPFNAAQVGNDYARPDLRVSGGWVQIKSSNNLSFSSINGFITIFTTA